jgi:hypothetical protein
MTVINLDRELTKLALYYYLYTRTRVVHGSCTSYIVFIADLKKNAASPYYGSAGDDLGSSAPYRSEPGPEGLVYLYGTAIGY